MLKSLLVNKDFHTWHLIGWQHSPQLIRSHVRKPLLTNMEFNIDFTTNRGRNTLHCTGPKLHSPISLPRLMMIPWHPNWYQEIATSLEITFGCKWNNFLYKLQQFPIIYWFIHWVLLVVIMSTNRQQTEGECVGLPCLPLYTSILLTNVN